LKKFFTEDREESEVSISVTLKYKSFLTFVSFCGKIWLRLCRAKVKCGSFRDRVRLIIIGRLPLPDLIEDEPC